MSERERAGEELEAFRETVREGLGEFVEFVEMFGDRPYGVDMAAWETSPDQRSLDQLSPAERAILEQEVMSELGVNPANEASFIRRYQKKDTSPNTKGEVENVEVYRSNREDMAVHIQHTAQGRALWLGPASVDISEE